MHYGFFLGYPFSDDLFDVFVLIKQDMIQISQCKFQVEFIFELIHILL